MHISITGFNPNEHIGFLLFRGNTIPSSKKLRLQREKYFLSKKIKMDLKSQ
jgi:hypothetical protein